MVPTFVLPLVVPVLGPIVLASKLLKIGLLPPRTVDLKELPAIVETKLIVESVEDRSLVLSSSVVTMDVIPFSCVLSPPFPTVETLAPVLSLFSREVSGLFSSEVRKLNVVNSPGAKPKFKDYPAFTN